MNNWKMSSLRIATIFSLLMVALGGCGSKDGKKTPKGNDPVIDLSSFHQVCEKPDRPGRTPAPKLEDYNPKLLSSSELKEFLAVKTGAKQIKVASYNFYNHFDYLHDIESVKGKKEHKRDYTWLPIDNWKLEMCDLFNRPGSFYHRQCRTTDYSEEKFELKSRQLSHAIDLLGDKPDVLAVQEIENTIAANSFKGVSGYDDYVMTTSPDKRGIDVAIFFETEKLKLIDSEEYVVQEKDLFTTKPTRNLLRANFKVLNSSNPNAILSVIAVHWPSLGNSNDKREAAAKRVQEIVGLEKQKHGANVSFVALGDFNTKPDPKIDRNPVREYLMCKNWDHRMVDAQDAFEALKLPERNAMPRATQWYFIQNVWERLDRILVSENMASENGDFQLVPESFRINSAEDVMTELEIVKAPNGRWSFREDNPDLKGEVKKVYVPYDSNFNALTADEAGYSDHMAIQVLLNVK